jgi:hypothetical protein
MNEFGYPALDPRQFRLLDSALAPHPGGLLSVWAQQDRDKPQDPIPGVVTFRGRLAGYHDGWVHLLRGDDTLRIGKGYVRKVWLVRTTPRNRAIGAGVGAVGLGLAAFVFSRGDRLGSGGDIGLVLGGLVVGAGAGFLLVPSSRPAGQIYPPSAVTVGARP